MILWRWHSEDRSWGGESLAPNLQVHLGDDAAILPREDGKCLLFARSGVSVNGLPSLPVRVLTDRDELRVSGATYYFTAVSLPEARRVSTGGRKIHCARCNGPIADDSIVFRCGVCRAPHHEKCWAYDTRCGSCRKETGEEWTPNALQEEK